MLKHFMSKLCWHATCLVSLHLATPHEVTAQSLTPTPGMMGQAAPLSLTDLPLQSQLRQRIEVLPQVQKSRAMAWLNSFSFPQSDLASLRVDKEGGVYYKDTNTPKPGRILPPTSASATNAALEVDAFHLHSRPGSVNKVFLDFDGHEITGTAWNETIETYRARAYDIDNNPANFSNEERSRIAEIWHRIAEDYAPFDIDVTTEEPQNFGPHIGRVLFTRDTDENGYDMPARGGGGVAYVNVWGFVDYQYYAPALVYYNALGEGYPPYMAEAGAHELGHNMGLSHDGVMDSSLNANCINLNEYFCGSGSGNISWAPIMGAGYYANVTEWSKGEYSGANNTQDDMDIIRDKLNYRQDDVKNTYAEATRLTVEPDGSIVSTNPQVDPANTDQVNKGLIETSSDKDIFWLNAGAGSLFINVNPAWDAYYRSDLRGANLDIRASLYDERGVLVVSDDPADETGATLSATVSAGRYYLIVSGVGNNITPYSDYASVGEYFISGQITSPSATDTTPPNPNPMTWLTRPYAQSRTEIAMKAVAATDNASQVQYQFRCVSGGVGCVNSGWQTSTSYVAGGLSPGASYSFSVIARDQAGNETSPSMAVSATTLSNRLPVLTEDAARIDIVELTSIDSTAYKIRVKVRSQMMVPVLTNDNDPDGDELTITAMSAPKYGTLTPNGNNVIYKLNNDGVFVFTNSTELLEFINGDVFTYTVSDGHGGTKSSAVRITPSIKDSF